MGSAIGVRKTSARRLGISLAEYEARLNAGEKWCTGCKEWHHRDAFVKDRSRTDGLASTCKKYRQQHHRETYSPRPRPTPGRRFVPARDGDVLQARRRVNYLVEAGLIPSPNDLPCVDCGHVRKLGQQRHEYDHYLGYDADHHEDVEAVCVPCHNGREATRRAAS